MNTRIAVIGLSIADAALIAAGAFLYMNLDRTAPAISFADDDRNLIYTEDLKEEELLEGVSAVDDVDGDVTESVLIEKISETADGNVIVTYAALDSSNNVAKRSRVYKKR